MKNYQLTIIGGGPGGYSAAFRAAELGKKVAIIDDNNLGGVCLNWGCIPTKALLKNAEVVELINNASEFGIELKSPKINFEKVIEKTIKARQRLSKGLHFQIRKLGIDFYPGYATFEEKNKISVDDIKISSEKFIIATGSRPKRLKNLEKSENVIYAKDIFSLKHLPKSLSIIGAGAIGIEYAYFFNAFGVEVSLIEAKSNILPNEDVEVSKWVEKVFKRKKIKIQTGTIAEKTDSETTLISIGVEGNTKGIGLRKLGMDIDESNHIIVDKNYRTNIDNIYAVGDVIGPPWLAHVSTVEGIFVADYVADKKPKSINYNCVPACTYSKPEIASIGFTEEQLVEKKINYKTAKSFFNSNGKAVATSSTDGFIKILVSEDNFILGAHIVGSNATEMISEFSLAMSNKLKIDNILDSIHPHPTFSEAIFETLLQLK